MPIIFIIFVRHQIPNKVNTTLSILKLSFWLICCLSTLLSANDKKPCSLETHKNIFSLFSTDGYTEISITADWDDIKNNKYQSEYHPATIQITSPTIKTAPYNVRLKARGKYRKKICDFPPLKINFDKDEFADVPLDAYESLKLVTSCKAEEGSEELILKEFLAYKILNNITEHSLRVQLVKLTCFDKSGSKYEDVKWGFLIENEEEFARRVGGEAIDTEAVLHENVESTNAAITSLFQYMIGNPDWNIETCKNLCLIKSPEHEGFLTVPYDFDFSGFVNAPYAVSSLGITSIKERVYLGSSDENDLDYAKKVLKSKKKEILKEIKSFEYISRATKREVLTYIHSFYDKIYEPLRDVAYYKARRERK